MYYKCTIINNIDFFMPERREQMNWMYYNYKI